MQQDEIETPWGPLTAESEFQLRDEDRQSTKPVAMPTRAGRASVTFHVDPDDEAVPAHVRMVMVAGCVKNPTPLPAGSADGQSTITVDGASLGWRVQAYIDPMTGDFADDKAIEAGLFDASGKSRYGLTQTEWSVREAATHAIYEGVASDPGVFARLYAALLARHVADLDEGVKAAAKALEDATWLRDRVRERVSAATDVAEGHQAPSPGR